MTVSDRNDNPPIFSDDIYSVSVPENYPTGIYIMLYTSHGGMCIIGTSVLTVMATDKDIGENAVISFHIVDGDINIFSLNCKSTVLIFHTPYSIPHTPYSMYTAETGVIQTTAELNFEAETQYSLTINASDNGAPVLQSMLLWL